MTEPGPRSARALPAAWGLTCFAWGAAIAWRYAGDGYMPVDHSIVFDGGWRILSGQVPYRDFFSLCGLTPIVVQAALFRFLGVTWMAMCAHAALANGLFALLVFAVLFRLALPRWLACAYAAMAAVFLYPPMGASLLRAGDLWLAAPVVAVVAAAWALALWRPRSRGTEEQGQEDRAALAALLALALVAITLAFVRLTNNEPEEGLALIVPAAGLAHAGWGGRRRTRAALRAAVGLVILAAAARDCVTFERAINVPRSVVAAHLQDAPPGGSPSPALAALSFRIPGEYRFTARDFGDVLEFLRQNPGNFWLVGDASILYGLSGRPSVNPALWFHPALTIPRRKDREFAWYDRLLLERLERYRVRFVILEGRQTWMESKLAHYPSAVGFIEAHHPTRRQLGGYTILDLGAPAS